MTRADGTQYNAWDCNALTISYTEVPLNSYWLYIVFPVAVTFLGLAVLTFWYKGLSKKIDWMEFLKFDWRKLILPAVFIALFVLTLNVFFSYGHLMDNFVCRFSTLVNKLSSDLSRNDTTSANQTIDSLRSLTGEISPTLNNLNSGINLFAPLIVEKLNPLSPTPCEFARNFNSEYFCANYVSIQTFACEKNLSQPFLLSIVQYNPVEYRQVSYLVIGLNLLFLFIEGYLISCLIISGYDFLKFRKKD
jgi:hypothetical protein